MRFSASFVALVAPLLVSGLPMRRTASAGDVTVLKFAHVLEQLETQFYSQALAKFQESDFLAAGFSSAQVPIQQFTAIQSDEATHTTGIEGILAVIGETPIQGCQFNFDSVLTSVSAMAPVARVVENLGVAAYLGAAHLMSDPTLLTTAASILTVEARHQTILNVLNGGSAIPQAFDIPFSPSEVLAVASPFISGCDVGIPANPTLTVTNTGKPAPGTLLTFSSSAINSTTTNLFCQMMLGGAPASITFPIDQCVVPQGINGPVALYITSDDNPLANNLQVQATNTVIAGPTMAFIDTVPEELSSLAITGSAGSSGSTPPPPPPAVSAGSVSTATATASAATDSSIVSVATDSSAATATAAAAASFVTSLTTITPEQASAILASASAAAATASASASGSAAPAATSAANNAASGSTSVVQTPGGPNLYTGPVSGGAITVLGWTKI